MTIPPRFRLLWFHITNSVIINRIRVLQMYNVTSRIPVYLGCQTVPKIGTATTLSGGGTLPVAEMNSPSDGQVS